MGREGGRPPFRKVLVANRGEIAIRVMRACREMGIASVAVYSDADRNAAHLRFADQSVHIGGAAAADSYLRGDRIVEAAIATGAEAVHPGYGFLSERDWFARAVVDAGLVFVGPPADAIALMGSKTSARTVAARAGVPVVPGNTEPLSSVAEARDLAREMGYPVLLKAAAGGGGKGMRTVVREDDLESAFDSARRESQAAFGDNAVYMEKYIVRPRHVEIQILGDRHGHLLHLGERECSVQRRHQKMVEEAPSVAVDADLRARMGEAAVRAARAVGYTNAGTCEFLLGADGNFYFLEMNTRLQVEHPVTELVTGIDIVQWQLRIAAGEALSIGQGEVAPRGWAIECRITSESPDGGFLPATGTVTHLGIPAGPGVRWDGGVLQGTHVGLNYDPLMGKLIVWGENRDVAIRRMERALRELSIVGVESSREFHMRLLNDADFVSGAVHVQWLESHLDRILSTASDPEVARAAAYLGATLVAAGHRTVGGGTPEASRTDGSTAGGGHGWPRWGTGGGGWRGA